MKENTLWKALESDIGNLLQTMSTKEIEFRNSFQSILGFPPDGFRSDEMLTDGKVLIIMEIECGQTHPDTNTGKYWFLYETGKRYRKIVLFQIYTPDFSSYGWRKKLAEFYVEHMKRSGVPLEYILLDYRNADNYSQVLEKIVNRIQQKVKEEFTTT